MGLRAILLCSLLVLSGSAGAQQLAAVDPAQKKVLPFRQAEPFIKVLGVIRPPKGWLQFCEAEPRDCVEFNEHETVELTKVKKQELGRINHEINAEVTPVTDSEHYGVTEKWTYPDDHKGDCEDYVLLKRQKLIERGWPASSLLITVVRDEKNEGHAVLTVHTSGGDFVLDNVHDEILAWYETSYRFVKRQSQDNIHEWVALTDKVGTEQAVAAGR